MGFKMDKHKQNHDTPGADASFKATRTKAIDRLKSLDADGHGFHPTVAGKQALNEAARERHIGSTEILSAHDVKMRIKRCAERGICFISLKPLEGKGTEVHTGHGVAKVLTKYVV